MSRTFESYFRSVYSDFDMDPEKFATIYNEKSKEDHVGDKEDFLACLRGCDAEEIFQVIGYGWHYEDGDKSRGVWPNADFFRVNDLNQGESANGWDVLTLMEDEDAIRAVFAECVGRDERTAREEAINWQAWVSHESLSCQETADWAEFWAEIAADLDLEDEFRENGII